MKIGFTGSRHGMTKRQRDALRVLLTTGLWQKPELHHGDCIGADSEAHGYAKYYGLRIVIHPPDVDRVRAGCNGDAKRRPKPYLQRNRDIVDETDCLVAAPATMREQARSGTWSTIRYARKLGRPVHILEP